MAGMLGTDVDTLEVAINAFNTWQTQAVAANCKLNQISFFINGEPVVAVWDDQLDPPGWRIHIS